MNQARSTLSSTVFVLFLCMAPLFGADLPGYLAPITSQIEQCIAKRDNESSKNFVNYERLRHNWEVRWWSRLGRKEVPTEDFIRGNPNLWNAATVVKLSLKADCESIVGVKRLLHGGLPPHKMANVREFANISSVVVTPIRVEVGTTGDNGKPVVSVFEKIGEKWMLTDVVLQME